MKISIELSKRLVCFGMKIPDSLIVEFKQLCDELIERSREEALQEAKNELLKNTTIYNKDCSRNDVLAEARYQFIEILEALQKND